MYERPLRSDELLHYGVLGMHWGIRRYQPYPKDYKGPGQEVGEARRIQDSIRNNIVPNDYSKTTVNLSNNRHIKEIGYKSDLRKAYKKYMQSEHELQKLYRKPIADLNKKHGINEYNSENPKNLALVDKLFEDFKDPKKYPKIAKAIKENAKYEKEVKDAVNKYADELLGNLGNVPVLKSKSEDYSVKRLVSELITRNVDEANYNAEKAYENAKAKDTYDLTFLEAVQNSPKYNNKKWMLSEYKKYLEDPDEYWKTRD